MPVLQVRVVVARVHLADTTIYLLKKISVIIPTLNEADCIASCLASLQTLRQLGHEVLVVDADSSDATISIAEKYADAVLSSPRGRARQLNYGTTNATGDLFLFLHADSLLPSRSIERLQKLLDKGEFWGRFDVQLSGSNIMFRVIEYFMNMRSRLSGIATGDQAMFVSRLLFEKAGGFPQIELMEDIDLSANLKKICRPVCLKEKVESSSRRWEQNGIIKTVLMMWMLRFRYAIGANPASLAKTYE
jgi:rSAM/selenodomain-associated transferase 2